VELVAGGFGRHQGIERSRVMIKPTWKAQLYRQSEQVKGFILIPMKGQRETGVLVLFIQKAQSLSSG
jgi:hypothetical protein